MDPREHWDRIESILDQILELPESERAAACARLAGNDSALRGEIQSLLNCVGGEHAVLDHPLDVQARLFPEQLLAANTRVGVYRVVAFLGSGGMGEVYRAERADGMFEQEVALKVMQPEAAAHAARFNAERQILARLEHPGIARLIDGGVLADERPYMIMELVSGEPLMAWCHHTASVVERVRLFADICAAVAYAHRNGIAHLDLKPQNVLVTRDGQPKLLDFGVARRLENPDAQTRMRDAPLTPGYAAPEQVTRGSVSMASDVYALGLLLYEMLCGRLPTARSSQDNGSGRQPTLPPPSRFAAGQPSSAASARFLQGDLDAIVAKALSQEPSARYASAGELLDELNAWRSGKVVTARPATIAYRVRKFAWRHKPEVAGAAGAVLALVAAALLFGWHQNRPEADLAGIDPRSMAVLPFLDLSEKHDQEYFSDGLSEELIDSLARNPALRVTARTSSFYFKGKSLDLSAIARQLHVANVLEGSVRRSGSTLRITSRLVRAQDGHQVWSHSYDRELTDTLKVQNEIASAVAVALQAKLVDNDSDSFDSQPVKPDAFDQYLLGRYLLTTQLQSGGTAAGIVALQKSIDLDPGYAPAYGALAFAKCVSAAAHGQSNVIEQSRSLLDKALALAPNLPVIYSARSMCRYYSLDFAGALADAERAVAGGAGDVRFHNALAYALASYGRLPEAVGTARQATTLDPVNLYAWEALGEFLIATHDWSSAENALQRAVTINPRAAFALFELATAQLLQGRTAEAADNYEQVSVPFMRQQGHIFIEQALGHTQQAQSALATLAASSGEAAPYAIAQLYAWQGDHDAALDWLQKALASRTPDLTGLNFDPFFQPLRGDARFQDLLRRLGLPTSA